MSLQVKVQDRNAGADDGARHLLRGTRVVERVSVHERRLQQQGRRRG